MCASHHMIPIRYLYILYNPFDTFFYQSNLVVIDCCFLTHILRQCENVNGRTTTMSFHWRVHTLIDIVRLECNARTIKSEPAKLFWAPRTIGSKLPLLTFVWPWYTYSSTSKTFEFTSHATANEIINLFFIKVWNQGLSRRYQALTAPPSRRLCSKRLVFERIVWKQTRFAKWTQNDNRKKTKIKPIKTSTTPKTNGKQEIRGKYVLMPLLGQPRNFLLTYEQYRAPARTPINIIRRF